MEGYFVKYSGAIRFDNNFNFGIYVYENEEDPTDLGLALINELDGTVIFTTFEDDGE